MTIFASHPFEDPDESKSEIRRWRGRLPAGVTVVTTGRGAERAGLTVSSLVVVEGESSFVVFWIDPTSELAEAIDVGTLVSVVQLVRGDEYLAEAFAGLVPAPGGPFTLASWRDEEFGPELDDRTTLGAEVTDVSELGWSRQITARINTVRFNQADTLTHVRGQYR